jgi:ankyrin repeat protein
LGTAIQIAAASNHANNSDIVKLLLSRGADYNIRDKNLETPLLSACWLGSLDSVKSLIEAKAFVEDLSEVLILPSHLVSSATLRAHPCCLSTFDGMGMLCIIVA